MYAFLVSTRLCEYLLFGPCGRVNLTDSSQDDVPRGRKGMHVSTMKGDVCSFD